MMSVTALQVLDEMSRDRVRRELVALADKVKSLIDKRENERTRVQRQVSSTVSMPLILTAVYQIEAWRLERIIQKHRETLEIIREVTKKVDDAGYRYLLEEVIYLQDDTYHWLGFNTGRLPGETRQHLHAAARHLRVQLSPN